MSKTTENLGLFKYDPSTDGAQTFNIEKALNENWDKLDAAVLLALAAAAPYSAQTYALGAYCTRGGRLYRCTTAITAAETWTAGHWTETTVTAELIAHATSKSNPHGVTAAQTGAYSKGETDTLLAKKVEFGDLLIDPDLNTLIAPGLYSVVINSTDLTVTNAPCQSHNASVFVEAQGGWSGQGRKQTFTTYAPGRMYYRTRNFSNSAWVWSAWQELTTTTDLDTKVSKSGDTMTGDLWLVANENGAVRVSGWDGPNGGKSMTIEASKTGGGKGRLILNSGSYDTSLIFQKYEGDTFYNTWNVLHTGNAQALGFPKIAIGSYVGTGTYSSANPNSLTFDFEPKVVIIVQNSHDNFPGSVFIRGQTLSGTIGENYISNSQLTVGWSGNTVTWYTNNSSYKDRAQLNISGNTYFYIALG